jgi:predicted nucleotidyltransferase
MKNPMHRLAGMVNFSSFAIFGSVARGEARKGSDIDLLIVYKDWYAGRTSPLQDWLAIFIRKADYIKYVSRRYVC